MSRLYPGPMLDPQHRLLSACHGSSNQGSVTSNEEERQQEFKGQRQGYEQRLEIIPSPRDGSPFRWFEEGYLNPPRRPSFHSIATPSPTTLPQPYVERQPDAIKDAFYKANMPNAPPLQLPNTDVHLSDEQTVDVFAPKPHSNHDSTPGHQPQSEVVPLQPSAATLLDRIASEEDLDTYFQEWCRKKGHSIKTLATLASFATTPSEFEVSELALVVREFHWDGNEMPMSQNVYDANHLAWHTSSQGDTEPFPLPSAKPKLLPQAEILAKWLRPGLSTVFKVVVADEEDWQAMETLLGEINVPGPAIHLMPCAVTQEGLSKAQAWLLTRAKGSSYRVTTRMHVAAYGEERGR